MDSGNINFKALWSAQKIEQPTLQNLRVRLDDFKKSNRKKIIITNSLLSATALFILFIWVYYQPQLITTKIGIVLIILAIAIFIISSSQNLNVLTRINEAENNQQYLKNLLVLKERQHFMHTTMLNAYFSILSAGLALYMYEYTSRMAIHWALVAYVLTGSWISVNWFYLRPRQIRKERSKTDDIISRFETIQAQLNQE